MRMCFSGAPGRPRGRCLITEGGGGGFDWPLLWALVAHSDPDPCRVWSARMHGRGSGIVGTTRVTRRQGDLEMSVWSADDGGASGARCQGRCVAALPPKALLSSLWGSERNNRTRCMVSCTGAWKLIMSTLPAWRHIMVLGWDHQLSFRSTVRETRVFQKPVPPELLPKLQSLSLFFSACSMVVLWLILNFKTLLDQGE